MAGADPVRGTASLAERASTCGTSQCLKGEDDRPRSHEVPSQACIRPSCNHAALRMNSAQILPKSASVVLQLGPLFEEFGRCQQHAELLVPTGLIQCPAYTDIVRTDVRRKVHPRLSSAHAHEHSAPHISECDSDESCQDWFRCGNVATANMRWPSGCVGHECLVPTPGEIA